jgi:hypothetical protein
MNEVAITQGYVASNLSSDPGEYIKAAARTSRQRFDAICSLSNLWSWKYPLFAVLSPWEDSVKPQINDGLKEAVAITAQYLVLWMQLAYHPTPTPDDGPHIMEAAFYRLTNAFLGEGRALDTYSNANNQPFMGNTGNYSGQCWKFTSLGNGYYRLTNMFLGEGRALDTYSNGKNDPFMGNTGNYGGQYWKLTQVR